MLAAQPAEYQSCYQCTATGTQADWYAADVDGQCSEQPACKYAESYEDHICLVGGTVYVCLLYTSDAADE